MRWVVSGASGFIGTALVRALRADGEDVVTLVRRAPTAEHQRQWEPARHEIDPAALDGADVVVHLAGAGIGDRRWSDERKRLILASRTRDNHITPDELGGGTFTLTNTGSRGALFDTPIINQPQVGILGTGSVVKRPVVVNDPELGEVVAIRSMVYLALTYDHRIVDGADAARFLVTVKERLEDGDFAGELGL
ncbi:MAG: hypothetical protein QOD07_785 [Frankiaceae bacterium]|nr:hypothetical protein [Frankiaceae bacterium]